MSRALLSRLRLAGTIFSLGEGRQAQEVEGEREVAAVTLLPPPQAVFPSSHPGLWRVVRAGVPLHRGVEGAPWLSLHTDQAAFFQLTPSASWQEEVTAHPSRGCQGVKIRAEMKGWGGAPITPIGIRVHTGWVSGKTGKTAVKTLTGVTYPFRVT